MAGLIQINYAKIRFDSIVIEQRSEGHLLSGTKYLEQNRELQ